MNMTELIISSVGAMFVVLFSIVGYFLSRVISDVKTNTEKIGKNTGKIDLVSQQLDTHDNNMSKLVEKIDAINSNLQNLLIELAKKGIDGRTD